MAVRPREPKQGNTAATAAVLVLAGCFAAPVLAASDRSLACQQDRAATLDIANYELTPVSHEVSGSEKTESAAKTIDSVTDDHLLKPRVEAAAREVFADGLDEKETDAAAEIESEVEDVSEPRLRPVSDNKLVPFRRQMYRKDI